jgi:hypothetical protein
MKRDLVELGLRVAEKVGSLRQVSTRQAVGVFVRPSLARGLSGSQKQTFRFVAKVKVLSLAISSPRSQVSERCSDAESLRTCRVGAATRTAVSLLGTFTGVVKRECRSTKVAM